MRTFARSFGRTFRLTAFPAFAALALGCDDASSPLGPPGAGGEVPPTEADPGQETVATRQELAQLIGGGRNWADGYVWADQPTLASYIPGSYYAFNRSRGPITITKPAGTTGRYIVTFTGLSAVLGGRSTVHVSGDNNASAGLPNDTHCKPVTAHLVSDKVEVRCFRASTRSAANSAFRVLVTRNYDDLAFAYASQPTAGRYSPGAAGSWNPVGSSTVLRNAVGQYEVVFNNLGAELPAGVRGHVQVNAIGTGGAHCKVENWGGTPALTVVVRCFSAAGLAVDSKFNVLFTVPSDHLAYAWVHDMASPSYPAIPEFSTNPAGSGVTVTRAGPGSYQVVWSNANPEIIDGGNVQVTAFGSEAIHCKVNTGGVSAGNDVEVLCFGATGIPADSRFNVLFGS